MFNVSIVNYFGYHNDYLVFNFPLILNGLGVLYTYVHY